MCRLILLAFSSLIITSIFIFNFSCSTSPSNSSSSSSSSSSVYATSSFTYPKVIRETVFNIDHTTNSYIIHQLYVDRVFGVSVVRYNDYYYTTNGLLTAYFTNFSICAIYYSGPGSDATWFTSDDYYYTYEKYGTNNYGGGINFSAGVDATFFTADDKAEYCWNDVINGVPFYTNGGNVIKRIIVVSPGPDLAWNTTDDIPSTVNSWYGGITYTADYSNPAPIIIFGSWSKRTSYDYAGIDGVWFTSDDRISMLVTHTFGTLSYFHTNEITYTNAGLDGVWGTSDDVMSKYSILSWTNSDLNTVTVTNN